MTEPTQSPPTGGPPTDGPPIGGPSIGGPSTAPGAPVDDRRADPPAPASAEHDGGTAASEAEREAQETIRSISRLEESN